MIVTSPTDTWLKKQLNTCASSVAVASPYVGDYLSTAISKINADISVTLLTRTVLTDFASGSSDLEAVVKLAQRSGGILSLSSLHAKVYVIDEQRALVTSANATFSGMYRNRECGIETTDRETVWSLTQLIQTGFGSSPRPQHWSTTDLEALRGPIETLRSALPKATLKQAPSLGMPARVGLRRNQFDRLIGGMPGWMRLTLEGVMRIHGDSFTMEQVYQACLPLIQQRYPENKFPRQKLRQQLQRLRDLGVILFLGKGRYERLTSIR